MESVCCILADTLQIGLKGLVRDSAALWSRILAVCLHATRLVNLQ